MLSKIRFISVMLVSAIIFSCVSIPFVFADTSTPDYAFNGANLTYQISGTYVFSYIGNVSYVVSNVNSTAQTFLVTVNYGGNLSEVYSSGSSVVTFQDPSPLPAVPPSVLQELLTGQGSGPYAYYTITTGVIVSVPAGTFTAVELQYGDTSMWVDQNTGIILKYTGSSSSLSSVDEELQSTNIAGASAFPTVLVAVIIAVVVVACVIIFLLFRRRSRQKLIDSNLNQSTNQCAISSATALNYKRNA